MRRTLQTMLSGYKRWISPFLPQACRFVPTCSEYAAEAIERHGAIAGVMLACERLLRCHPFARAGYDPVPRRIWKSGRTGNIDCHPERGAQRRVEGPLYDRMKTPTNRGPSTALFACDESLRSG